MITKKKMIMAIAAIIIAISGYYFFVQAEKKQVEKDPLFAEMGQQDKELIKEEVAKSEPAIIKVDVKGAVRTPGVFIAKLGDRVIDLIAAAGDFTKDADADKVNLAQLVEDQMVIYVPRAGEEAVELADAASASTGGAVATTSTTGSSSGNQVNLNTATQAELETLPGIGPSKAIAIIEYRETTGKFQQIEDLKNISGIGDKTFEKLQDSITVQ
jgi:competence protein ComEA